jgi:SAM-dependent methyltransferase
MLFRPLNRPAGLDQSFLDKGTISRVAKIGDLFRKGKDVGNEIAAELEKYTFYHSIEIHAGLKTASKVGWAQDFQNAFYSAVENIEFRGKRVLDIGCRDGAMLLFAEERGAAELVGIDNDPSPGLANFVVPFKASKIRLFGANIYDLTPAALGKFDIVICCGLIYHLRYPMLGIKRMADLLADNGKLIVETALIDAFHDMPILFNPLGAQSPFESSSPTFFNLAGLANAFSQASLTAPIVLKQFNIGSFDAAAKFPEFGASTLNCSFKIPRTVVEASKISAAEVDLEKYFEGRHRFHSTGTF